MDGGKEAESTREILRAPQKKRTRQPSKIPPFCTQGKKVADPCRAKSLTQQDARQGRRAAFLTES